ncbi:MAG: hypothetical protein JXA57_19875 [Armatimonadetes bacterium]|nr:hypothetical protein [Armatimonadota bacterium]
MKCTRYFFSVRERPDRAAIRVEWIATAVSNPLCAQTQNDGRIRHWIWVEEVHRYLRVILLEDGETVHNAFFDRGFREE